ncbi:MAG TPA: hypothetical protein VG734_18015 [Lacunisphaera sp.]|nr:hypothetical protein [Lacunisphaera sp.]
MSLTAHPHYALAQQIAMTTADYEGGEPGSMNAARVIRWVGQFSAEHQQAILAEMSHVLERCYISKQRMAEFLDGLTTNAKLTGGDPGKFWGQAELLDIQERGMSQRDMVALLRERLNGKGLPTKPTMEPAHFVYLDDAIFTGNHLFRDLSKWINQSAPQETSVHVITAALHRSGHYRALINKKENLNTIAKAAGKSITFTCWRLDDLEIEDRRFSVNVSDVLRPKAAPADVRVEAYVTTLEEELRVAAEKYKIAFGLTWRSGDNVGNGKFFSSGAARALLEEQMLIAGCRIRELSPHFNQSARPLGYQFLSTLGFGGLVVTYRNCPNNCPLAWWADAPWYPLFPRRTNNTTAIVRMFEDLT